jgi:hypothetical protein
MGVIFQSGIAIGAVPGFSNFGVTRGWLLGTEDFGNQPAWDNGVMTLIVNDMGVTNFISVLDGDDPDFALYISGEDSKGIDQSAFLSQVINNTGTMTFSQGSASVTIGFDETTFQANNYSNITGIQYDNNGTPPYFISGTGVFYGFNNAGFPSTEDHDDPYNVQPSNAQVLTISINVGVTPTPTPTATTAGPTPTPTPTPTNSGVGSWYFYSDEGNINTGPPISNGNAIFTIQGDPIVETFNPNKVSGVTYLYFNVNDSVGTNYTTQFSGLTTGGTITLSQNGDTATYTSTTPGSFNVLNEGGGTFFVIATTPSTQTKSSNASYVFGIPISLTFGS